MIGNRFKKENVFWVFLLGYHFLFIFLNFKYFSENGGDASFYWFQAKASQGKTLTDLFHYGSESLLLFNYFFAKVLNLNILFGFVLYGCIGYLGILQFYRLCKLLLKDRLSFKGISLGCILVLLPNLHFWTAGLGKEAFCFLFIATVFLEFAKERFASLAMIFSMLLLAVIRPHVANLLLFSVVLVYFFSNRLTFKKRMILLIGSSVSLSILFYMFLQLSKIKTFDLERIKRFNEFSLLSFKNSGSYVPIIEYSYPYKVFTFYFRPLANEIPTFYGIVLGVENAVILLLHLTALLIVVLNWKRICFQPVMKIILVFALISGILIVQRYSGLGIFARTKIMIQPFVCLILLWILTFRKIAQTDE
ncbi:hypothetical protein LZZ90_07155 [Flavobacterium sp. SM15]|uniref:hypothetical protein n=1 Tax=Flavobacterium sp. SM15 TaxID=2908005 RepID=UPI001EDB641F|nr:hypothetical protein [Flavobacterium sp. SM15]MCG2611280.1 hypothetical protein [Flavobacterium sp. SM15]